MKKGTQAKRDAARLAVTAEVADHPAGPREALTRAHIETMRVAGSTKAEVLSLVRNLGGDYLANVIAKDLDSYGEWAG